MEIKRTPVESSNVKSIGYDSESQTLEVAFSSGGIYRYANVPADAHHNLMAASSKGGFLAARIKPFYAASTVGREEKESGAHGQQDVETLERQDDPYSQIDIRILSDKCLAKTPDKDPTGWQVQGELWDDMAPLYCGLPARHEGAHSWEGLCCMAGPLKAYLISVLDSCGYTYSETLTSGGPGGHMIIGISPKAGG